MPSSVSTKGNVVANVTGQNRGILATGKITTFDGDDSVDIAGCTPDCIVLYGLEAVDGTTNLFDDLVAVPDNGSVAFTATATGGAGTVSFVVIKP
jgi:hypothetical protein